MAEPTHNREIVWGSYDGRDNLLKDMDDQYVVNVTHMLIEREKNYRHKFNAAEAMKATTLIGEEEELFSNKEVLIRMYTNLLEKNEELLANFKAEMAYRNIPEKALIDAPYPFVDDKGCERKWNYEKGGFDFSPPAARFIKED
ncbi:hypothetical protein N9948_01970 [bacterium]|nr:hypothetical protein [bacterium]